jgi:regulatory protein
MSAEAMRRRLVRAGATAETAAGVVDRLVAERWIDDVAFATAVARRGFADHGWSERRILLSLRRAGVAAPIADRAIAAADAEAPERREAKLLRLAERKWATLQRRDGVDDRQRRQRFAAWLARRGFAGADVRRLTELVIRRSGSG